MVGLIGARRRSRVFAAVCLLLIAAPPAGASGHRRLYQQGQEAIIVQDWDEVARLMRAAIAIEPEADARLRRRQPYTPYFFLGLAHFELGDCQGALREWEESERQGVIRDVEQYPALVEKRQRCRERLAREADERERRALRDGERAALAAGRERAERLRQRAGADTRGRSWTGEMDGRLAGATARLDEAAAILEKDEPLLERDELAAAASAIAGAASELAALEEELRASLGSRIEDALGDLTALQVRARQELAGASGLAPYPAGLETARRRLDAALAATLEHGAASRPGELEAAVRQLRSALADFREAATAPPAWLLEAAEAFVGGLYEEVLAVEPGEERPEPRALSHLHLLRAASALALDVRAGGGSEHLETARREVAAVLDGDAPLRPDPALFSGALIDLFAQVEAARAALSPGLDESAAPGAEPPPVDEPPGARRR